MRVFHYVAALTALSGLMHATTLQQLPIPEMAQKSTAIVRAKVLDSSAVRKGEDVYTVYRVEVAESWKHAAGSRTSPRTMEVAIPGGVAGGIRQVVSQQVRRRVSYAYAGGGGRTGFPRALHAEPAALYGPAIAEDSLQAAHLS